MQVQPHAILYPLLAQVVLIFVVWCWMYYLRIKTILRGRIDLQDLADEHKFDALLAKVANPSDNLENLFEMPILFFVAAILIDYLQLTDSIYLASAWFFVISRVAHSVVHCTYNLIVHRFVTYFVGSLVLWAMWGRLIFRLTQA